MNRVCIKFYIVTLLTLFQVSIFYAQQIESSILPSLKFRKLNTNNGLSSDNINCIYQDKTGFIWIGSNGGLNKYDGSTVKNYSRISNGVSSYLIADISEDNNGELWFSTKESGVYRFNPVLEEYHQYNHNPDDITTISSDYVFNCRADSNGVLWLATNNGINYITKYDKNYGQGAIFKQVPKSKSYHFRKIIPINKHTICASSIQGLYIIKTQRNSIKYEIDKCRNSNVFEIELDKGGRLWGNSANQLFILNYDEVDDIYSTIDYSILHQNSIYNVGEITCFTFDLKGNIWIGTSENGLFSGKIDHNSKQIVLKTHSFLKSSENNSLSNNMVRSLFIDKTNVLWIGTEGGGVNILDLEAKRFNHIVEFNEDVNSKIVKAIYEDDKKNVWMGVDGSGLYFQPSPKTAATKPTIIKTDFKDEVLNDVMKSVNIIYQTKDGIIWVGTEGRGLCSFIYRYDEKRNRLHCKLHSQPSYNNHILSGPATTAMYEDEEGRFWIGTYTNGLKYAIRDKAGRIVNCIHLSHNTNNEFSLSSNIIRSISKGTEGAMWIGTGNGLNQMHITPDGGINFKRFFYQPNDSSTISNNYILPLFYSSSGTLWIGTLGGGLNKFISGINRGEGTFKSYQETDGLPNNVVKSIQEGKDGLLWISTNRGISKFDVENEIFENYTVDDGLQGNSFNELASILRSNGELMFGGVNGITHFFPNEIKSNPFPKKIVLTQLSILGKKVEVGEKLNGRVLLQKTPTVTDQITLLYQENSIELEFAVLHFANPTNNKVKYKLEGFDNAWHELSSVERSIKYTSLPPGNYNLFLKPSEETGNNHQTWTSLSIEVKPPFWLTGWAVGLYVLLILGFILVFSRFSLIKINKKNELLMEHFEREKTAELARLKLNFFTQISHEFRTPLTLIVGTIENLFSNHQVHEKSIKLIRRHVNSILRLITQLTNFQKYEQGKLELQVSKFNIAEFGKEIFESFGDIAKQKEIEYNFSSSSNYISLWYDEDKLEKILFNLISNAIKFTHKQGRVGVKILESEKYVEVIVSDNGVGIPAEEQEQVFDLFFRANKTGNLGTGIGLAFSKKLAQMHSGDILFESKVGEGTKFYLQLKKGKKHFNQAELVEKGIGNKLENLSQNKEWREPVCVEEDAKDVEVDRSSFAKVLIVEDDVDIRKFLYQNLKNEYHVIEASNGREAWEKCKTQLPDLVISDIMMPEMDGFELCKMIKNEDKTNQIPVLLLSARGEVDDKIKGFELEADEYMIKPFYVTELKVRVKALIKTRKKILDHSSTHITLEPEEITISKADEHFIKKAKKTMEKNISNPEYSVNNFASDMGISAPNLNMKFKKITNQTTVKFMRTVKLKRAIQLLKLGTPIVDVADETGYNSVRRFRDSFKEVYGVAPSEYFKDIERL